jgi:Fe-Mn family superoxide dismutase
MKYELPKLSYGFGALEPYIDAQTMEIHYTKHHQAYIDKMNAVLEKYPANEGKSIEDMLRNLGAASPKMTGSPSRIMAAATGITSSSGK